MSTLPETDWTAIERERHEAVADFLTPSPPPFSAQAPERPGPAVATPSLPAPGDDPSGQALDFDTPQPRPGEDQDAYLARVGQIARKILARTGADVTTTVLPLEGLRWKPYWYRTLWRRWLG